MTVATESATPTSRQELEEAMTNLVGTLNRMPRHWVERRAGYHAKIDALLDEWQQHG